MKNKIVVVLVLFTLSKVKAQSPVAFYVSYYNSDRSQLKMGAEWFSTAARYRVFYGMGYGMVATQKQYKGLLDYHVSCNTNKGFLFKVSGSDVNLAPTVGISLLNAMDLDVGYSFAINKKEVPVIQGFTVGFTVRLSKNKNAFEKWHIGF
ncbi:hypothetical protein B0A58_15760 [Flavobacterium branchiophilum NBRC 15030 = ATCC 35035]|uniref:Uncharacterized protein n=1 Tax=Flavobacterium branchiophilum TaxID=55197 RepID=A0A543G1X0_9FLAO|nr:hypothetical protein [Flavobacterium branchiophilum]OXA67769.1 hypothetical protein B0A58_15760 [Flavobacterium branchiophilum NBRC 15030 = ATCC 35035]TQM40035.1 hypothetical protein BC670_0896 [Flavobacterium branchiophilum]GEM56693.1 hypothetical protein FB1_29140 [Flavobacterium branchiophilum NBRC 15030 = ATCC 35035]